MQEAKDTFYIMLRDRLAAWNAGRTTVVRGGPRPAVLVNENELVSASQPADLFCLRWTELRNVRGLISMLCEIHYATGGSPGSSGMDRGRLLAVMDAELAGTLNAAPQNVALSNFIAGGNGVTLGSRIFWGDVLFGAARAEGERLERIATVEVFATAKEREL